MIGADVGGMAVHIGARIGALGGPGEVLASSTVRDLVVGSGIEFDERGEHELKGVPGSWRVFAASAGERVDNSEEILRFASGLLGPLGATGREIMNRGKRPRSLTSCRARARCR